MHYDSVADLELVITDVDRELRERETSSGFTENSRRKPRPSGRG